MTATSASFLTLPPKALCFQDVRHSFQSDFKPQLGEYCSLKFRPGSGNYIDPKVGSACAGL